MKNLIRNMKLAPGKSILFFSISVSLLALSLVQVDCPICRSSGVTSNPENLKVIEVKGEIIDYHVLGDKGCGGLSFYVTVNCKIDITVLNEGSESLSTPLLFYASVYGYLAEFIYIHIEIPGKETKHIQEIVQINIIGGSIPGRVILPKPEVVVSEIEFSVIRDPEQLALNCPVCYGKEKVAFTEWLRIKAQ